MEPVELGFLSQEGHGTGHKQWRTRELTGSERVKNPPVHAQNHISQISRLYTGKP